MMNSSAAFSPDLPWSCFKPDDLGKCIMNFVEDHETYFRWWAQVWYENFQFLFGNHNIKWSRRNGFAVDYDSLRNQAPNASMRSQTNISRVVVEALASMIYANLPEWEVEAMEESALKGKRYRKITQKLLDCLMIRMCMDKDFANAAVQYVLFGQFAFKADWDSSSGTLIEIPQWRKTQSPQYSDYMAPNQATGGLLETPTPLLDPTGQPIMSDNWEPIVDQLGKQIVKRLAAGSTTSKVLSPLEYRRAIGSAGMHKTNYVEEFRLIDYDQFMDEYRDIDGQTKAYKKVKPVTGDAQVYGFAVRHFMRLQMTTPPTMEEFASRKGGVFKSSLFKYKVFVVEHYDRPSRDKWPEGRRVIVCNGEATHVTKPSYNVPGKDDGWHPYSEAQWLTVAPSSISPGPMNDVTRKNRELNVKDSLNATSIRRNMGSALILKTGSGLDPQKMTGEPGQVHEASDIYGARYLHDDLPIPPVIAQLRQQDKEDVYEVSGAGDALRGQPSTGASSGYQEKQREEREEKRLAPARKFFEQAVSSHGEKLIFAMKCNVRKLDENMMGYLRNSGSGEFTAQDVVAFLSTPFSFGTDIKVKKSSMALRSKATMQATLQELAGGALGERLKTDAKVLDKYLQFFDAETLRDASAAHRDRAARENETFLDFMKLGPNADGIRKPIVMFEDDDMIHLAEHGEFAVTHAEELLQTEWLLVQFLTHSEQHRIQNQEKQGQMAPGTALQTGAMMQTAMQQPAPTVQTIYQHTMMEQQQAQQAAKHPGKSPPPGGPPAATGGGQAPQAPRPGGKTDPGAPSGNTPPAMSKGGLQ
jgi:hypothetical protein